jgi:hypothetical protein
VVPITLINPRISPLTNLESSSFLELELIWQSVWVSRELQAVPKGTL